MRLASPTTSTTTPTSAAITRYVGPATSCAENTAYLSSSQDGARHKLTLNIEHQDAQKGTSYKERLKATIGRLIPVSPNREYLLVRLQREAVKLSGISISPSVCRTSSGSPGSKLWMAVTHKKPLPPSAPRKPSGYGMVDGSLFLGKQINTYSKLNSVYARYKALRNEENSCVDLIEIISRR